MAERDLYIDRLRTATTALVVLHHAAIAYGGSGGWFYHEIEFSSRPSSLLLTFFLATNQAYFMGFFFLLAGYFTPGALERKGYARFLGDRFLRLGLPLLAFGLILGPLTAAMVNYAKGEGFWSCIAWLWQHKHFINGPLWFAQALLLFSLGYCGWRTALGAPLSGSVRVPRPLPAHLQWLLSALCVGAAALAIRQFCPTGQNVFGLQLGFFASYVFLFIVGIAAWRNDWLRQFDWSDARPWVVSLCVAWPLLPAALALAMNMKAIGPGKASFSGGLSWPAILYAFWEPFVAWGLIAAWLLVFRERMNRPSKGWAWLNRRAYAVYIVHPPILVGVSLLLRGWVAPPLLKWGVVGPLACIFCWLVADTVVRIPGIRRAV
jgi:fucose 4-O-acetylase-like acetyltransferase